MCRFLKLSALGLLASLVVSGASEAAEFHLIEVASTRDLTLQKGATSSELAVKDYFRVVASKLKMDAKPPVVVDGDDFVNNNEGCAKIQKAIDGLSVSKDDVVVFYYAGHGFSTDDVSKKDAHGNNAKIKKETFPYFNCAGTVPPFFGLSDAARKIASKGPHFVLAIADTCNKAAERVPTYAFPTSAGQVDDYASLHHLFVDSSGVLILSAAQKGQYAYYVDQGGFFTIQVLDAFSSEISLGKKARWNHLIPAATRPIRVEDLDAQKHLRLIALQKPISDDSALREP